MGSANGAGTRADDSDGMPGAGTGAGTYAGAGTGATGDARFDVPVLMAGGLTSTKDGDALLQQGICDFAGFGRAALRNNFML